MARLSLERICSSSKAKIIETNNGTFVLGHLQPSKYKIYDESKNQYLDGIYASEDFTVKNSLMNPLLNDSLDTDIDVRGPLGEYVSLVQGKNFAIGIKAETLNGIANYNSLCSYYEIEPELIPVYQKPTSGYTQEYFNNLSAPRAYLSGLLYAYISEMPLDNIAYDFDSGILYGDSLSLKNPYDYKYDLNIIDNEYLFNYTENQTLTGNRFILGSTSATATGFFATNIFAPNPGSYNNSIVYSKSDRLIVGNGYSAKIFELSGDTWVPDQLLSGRSDYGAPFALVPVDSEGYYDNRFSYSVAISGNYCVVGAPSETAPNPFGAIYVYENSVSGWNCIQSLTAHVSSIDAYSTNFGTHVEMYNDKLIVPITKDSLTVNQCNTIAAYKLDSGLYTYVDTISCSSPVYDNCVKIYDNKIALIDELNIIRLYELSGSNWNEIDSLSSVSATTYNNSLTFCNDIIAIGYPSEQITVSTTNYTKTGMVEIYNVSGGNLVFSEILTSPYNQPELASVDDDYGTWTHLSNNGTRLVITAPKENITPPLSSTSPDGIVFVYGLVNNRWILQNELPRITGSDWPNIATFGDNDDLFLSRNGYVDVYGENMSTPNKFTIEDTRTYNKIGINKNDAWISYNNSENIYTTDFYDAATGNEQILELTQQLSEYNLMRNELPATLSAFNAQGRLYLGYTEPFYHYEQIERIKGFTRLDSNDAKHKSNIFSIRIKNTNLNEAIEDEDLRQNIQTSIEKSIREVIKKITPANTQLWKIEWRGD